MTDVVRAVEDNCGSEAGAAEWFRIDESVVATAMRFYRDHRDEVDGWIREEDEYAERAEAEWRREHRHSLK